MAGPIAVKRRIKKPEKAEASSLPLMGPSGGARSRPSDEAQLVATGSRRPASRLSPLHVNALVGEAVREVRRTMGNMVRLRAVPADRDVRVMTNREEMSGALALLVAHSSEIIRKGGSITILAKVLPIENALLEEKRCGCVLLSVSSSDVAVDRGSRRAAKRSASSAFHAVLSIIKQYSGSLRVFIEREKAMFNIYLPAAIEVAA